MNTTLYADAYLDKLKNDVYPIFCQAIGLRQVDWRHECRAHVLGYFSASDYEIDFDPQLQNWARMYNAHGDCAYLWRDFPLLMIRDRDLNEDLTARFGYLNIISVPDMKSHKINISSMALIENYLLFGGDTDGFSAYDMYRETNSRE